MASSAVEETDFILFLEAAGMIGAPLSAMQR
jgi:hypothetical protein